MGVRARLRAVCVVANPRYSQAIAVVCASQPIPNRILHTFIRDHEHVLSHSAPHRAYAKPWLYALPRLRRDRMRHHCSAATMAAYTATSAHWFLPRRIQ